MPKNSIALITGINGQDGSYLAELLLAKGYEVHGTVRADGLVAGSGRLANLDPFLSRLTLHGGDIEDASFVSSLLAKVKPTECYHLAGPSFVSFAFGEEKSVVASYANSTHFLLEGIKNIVPQCRFYFAGSSEMFGAADAAPQNEATAFHPRSVYGIGKVAGYHLVAKYRKQDQIYSCTGILFNHESPRRGQAFVTRKISSTVARISLGLAKEIRLGNVDARRDWGYAPEYVEAMWRMLHQENPGDYVVATGRLHTVRELLEYAFGAVKLDYQEFLKVDPSLFRPDEEVPLQGDATKAKEVLGWKPTKDFREMIGEMVISDIRALKESR